MLLEDLFAHPLALVALLMTVAGAVAAGILAADLGTRQPAQLPLLVAIAGLLFVMLFLGLGRRRAVLRGHGTPLNGWPKHGFYGWSLSIALGMNCLLAAILSGQSWPAWAVVPFLALPVLAITALGLSLYEEQRRDTAATGGTR